MAQTAKDEELELFQSFIDETKTNIEEIEKGILALEGRPENNIDIINTLLVQFHTVKGNAKFFELKEMNELCHAAESCLEDIKNKKRPFNHSLVEILFESEDILKKLLETLIEKLETKEEGKPVSLNSESLVEPVIKKLSESPKENTEIESEKETKGTDISPDTTEGTGTEETAEEEDEQKTSLTGKFLTFRLDDEHHAIPIGYIQDIIKLLNITPVPQTAEFVKGLINLRGKVVPVIDLRLLFSIPQKEYNEETCIIIVKGTKGLIGLVVDVVSEVIDINESEVEETPDFGEIINTEFILGVSKINNEVKILLNIERILSDSKMVVG